MRRVSLVAKGNILSIERTERGDLLRRRWFNATLRRIILPEPVILTRFAIALCVFSFCFMTLLSVFLINSSIPQWLLRRRREACFWSEPRMPGEYSTPVRILQQFGFLDLLSLTICAVNPAWRFSLLDRPDFLALTRCCSSSPSVSCSPPPNQEQPGQSCHILV